MFKFKDYNSGKTDGTSAWSINLKNMSIYEVAENVKTRKDFEEFLKLLKTNFFSAKTEWHNDTLESFLEGLYGYNYDSGIEEKAS